MIEAFQRWLAGQAFELFAVVSGALMHVMFAWQHPKIAARQFVICVLSGYWFGPVIGNFIIEYTFLTGDKVYGACLAATGLGGVYALEIIVFAWRAVKDNPASLLRLLPTWRRP